MISVNMFLGAYLIIFIISYIADLVLDLINCVNLKRYGNEVPNEFIGVIDEEELIKMNEYTFDNTKLSVFRSLVGKIIFLVIILSGFLPWITEAISDFPFIPAGLIFIAIPSIIGSLAGLPFDYYGIFHVEEKYGFNTRTLGIWISDLFKSLLIGVILGVILLSLLLLMIRYSGNFWWIWAWVIFFCFQLLMVIIYPTIIAPIFNKFIPVGDTGLAEKIKHLSEQEGLTVKGIFQMDAARRSRHTNAYFSGLGRSKRIVLYDTLLESHEDDEILSVLAHEIGHLKRGHIKKQLIFMGVASFILFFLASVMIKWDLMYESFGFSLMPAYVGLFLIGVLWDPIGFFLSPVAMIISRKFEREADLHVYESLKTTEPMINALKRLAKDNLSNLRPHPLYVGFHYSHPPLLERIDRLEHMADNSHLNYRDKRL
ncbi:M48 family metallopeptidase [Thermodesulfobacteriota bacterium]